MPTKSTTTTGTNNIRQQIISKTPRVKRKRLNTKQKEAAEPPAGKSE